MFIISIFILFITHAIIASPACMDNSLYGYIKEGYDYKTYHFVECTCPCERYKQSYKRGICEQCLHPKAPLRLNRKKNNRLSYQEYKTCQFIKHALSNNGSIQK